MNSIVEETSQFSKEQLSRKLKQMLGEIEDHEMILLLRKRLSLNQFDICSKTGIIPQQLSAFESGKKELPDDKISNIVYLLESLEK